MFKERFLCYQERPRGGTFDSFGQAPDKAVEKAPDQAKLEVFKAEFEKALEAAGVTDLIFFIVNEKEVGFGVETSDGRKIGFKWDHNKGNWSGFNFHNGSYLAFGLDETALSQEMVISAGRIKKAEENHRVLAEMTPDDRRDIERKTISQLLEKVSKHTFKNVTLRAAPDMSYIDMYIGKKFTRRVFAIVYENQRYPIICAVRKQVEKIPRTLKEAKALSKTGLLLSGFSFEPSAQYDEVMSVEDPKLKKYFESKGYTVTLDYAADARFVIEKNSKTFAVTPSYEEVDGQMVTAFSYIGDDGYVDLDSVAALEAILAVELAPNMP